MANFSYVIDSSFSPFSMQEMLVPFTAYKDAFEKTEEAYNDLSDKSDKFKYLSEKLPEGSKARQIYEGYANDLRTQAEDLAHNGLSMSNRRALTSMKRRYAGEIGRLSQADEALKEEKKIRQTLNAQDSSRLYATDNLSIDEFLDGNNPNLYSVSGNELYTRGAAAGKAASSRVFSAGDAGSTLNGYYRDYVQKMGYSAETIRKFYQDMSAIPELQMAADAILEERGVNQNLTGVNLQRARQSVINGMIDGAVYSEQHNPQRDLGVLTKAEEVADERQKQQQAIALWAAGATMDENGNIVGDPNNINYQTKDVANKQAQQATEIAKIQADIMYPVGGDGERHLNPAYKITAGGTPKLATNTGSNSDPLSTELLKLKNKNLAHNQGFDVTVNGDRKHYNYIGAVSSHKGSWYTGRLGDDNPGHDGWGFTSSSNVEDIWGNFSAEGDDSKKMKVLSYSELAALTAADPNLEKAIDNMIKAAVDAGTPLHDFRVIEVPNEKDSNKKGYLVALN